MLVGDAREGICFRMRWVESVMCRALHFFSIMAPISVAERPHSATQGIVSRFCQPVKP